ncbi:MAG: type IV toxin-antitoxin system AbiEi family antitoxin domain-containing protein [Chthoniobacteraceae bacterium]
MPRKRNALKPPPTTAERLLSLVRERRLIRPVEVTEAGATRQQLSRLVTRGLIVKHARGLYGPADEDVTENHSLAEVCKRVSHGVVCLLSALQFHDLGTQLPAEVWLAVPRAAWRPRMDTLRLRLVFLPDVALCRSVETHVIEGVGVRVFSPARTVADCFKFRSKVGVDVAIEALRELRRRKLATSDEIWREARHCRVANVMRPYLEAIS